nr:hypothetical protein [Tanacetum cinerariifolium]
RPRKGIAGNIDDDARNNANRVLEHCNAKKATSEVADGKLAMPKK